MVEKLLLVFKLLPVHWAFQMGRASYLEGEILGAESVPANVTDRLGRSAGVLLLCHYRIKTGALTKGRAGWRRFLQACVEAPRGAAVVLRCGYCGHRYVLRVPAAGEPSGGPASIERLAVPASFRSEWFRFPLRGGGDSALDCPQCEQNGAPAVSLLWARRR